MAMASVSVSTVGTTTTSSNPLIWDKPQRENFKSAFLSEMERLGLNPESKSDIHLLASYVDPVRNRAANKLLAASGKELIPFNATLEGFSPEFAQAVVDRGAARRVNDAAVQAFSGNTGVFGEGGQFEDQFGQNTGGKIKTASVNMNEESISFFRNAEMRSRYAYALKLEQLMEALGQRRQSA